MQAAPSGAEPAQQCRVSSGKVTPFAFYPSLIPTLTGAIKQQPGVMKLSGRRDLNPNEFHVPVPSVCGGTAAMPAGHGDGL